MGGSRRCVTEKPTTLAPFGSVARMQSRMVGLFKALGSQVDTSVNKFVKEVETPPSFRITFSKVTRQKVGALTILEADKDTDARHQL